jgi:outer membrane protein assembly factor BamB
MQKKIKTILLLTISLIPLSCQPPEIRVFNPDLSGAVLTAHQSYTRSGYQSFDLKDSLKIIQEESLGGLPYFSFLHYSGELIYTTHNGRLYFTGLNNFDDTRKTKIDEGIGTAPTISGSTLFIAVNRGKHGLIAYDMLKGKYLWQLEGQFSQSSPVVLGNRVIHATTFGAISAHDFITGERKWKVEINDRILNNLAYVRGSVIVLTQNGTLRSYNPENSSLNWSLSMHDAFYASPVVNSDNVYIASYNGNVSKIDLLKGIILKKAKLNSNIYMTPGLDDQSLYIGKGNGQLIALDHNTLEEKWSQSLEGPVTAAPLVSNTEIILGTASRKLYRITKKDGKIKQMIRLAGKPRSQPAYHDNKIYISYEPDYIAVLGSGSVNE